MENNMIVKTNEMFGDLRIVMVNSEPWFVGKDIAEKLGYAKPRNAISNHVDDEDKGVAPIQGDLGGTQEMTIINESGLYSLILKSKLPEAKQFKRWVTSEVLPSIRKDGGYIATNSDMSDEEIMGKFNIMENVKVSKNQERLGQTIMQNCGEIAFIVEYVNSKDIAVQFKTSGELVKTTYSNFVKGEIKSHFTPTVYGVGIIGLQPTVDENGEQLNSYNCWRKMLQRCYSAKCQKKQPTYKGCSVCDEWLYYSNFKEWYDNNYYEINNKTSQLDKDILFKGNKVYSPDTCIFVPQFINSLFIKCQNSRGQYPIGVCYKKANKKYQASLSVFKDGKTVKKYLGYFDTADEAFETYKKAKEEYIKEIADKYKDIIPVELYKSMYAYKVEIDD